jgi:hypothetical protein
LAALCFFDAGRFRLGGYLFRAMRERTCRRPGLDVSQSIFDVARAKANERGAVTGDSPALQRSATNMKSLGEFLF